jgi:uncharacterized iron-regulated protein
MERMIWRPEIDGLVMKCADYVLVDDVMNQTISLVSERLTRSEIESLRREKKQLSDYAQKELSPRIKAALQSLVK